MPFGWLWLVDGFNFNCETFLGIGRRESIVLSEPFRALLSRLLLLAGTGFDAERTILGIGGVSTQTKLFVTNSGRVASA